MQARHGNTAPLTVNAATADEGEAASDRAVVALRVDQMSARFRGSLERYELPDGVGVIVAHAGPHGLSRTQTLVDASPDSGILLAVNLAGRSTVAQHERISAVGVNEATVYDTRVPYALSFPEWIHCYVVQVPRRSLRVPATTVERGTARTVPASMPELGHLRRYLDIILPTVAAQPGPALQTLMTRTLCDLVGLTLQHLSGGPARHTHASLLAELQSTVHAELSNPALSPSWLAQRHFVSLRLVHDVFSAAGSAPAAYIRQQRLERAVRLLHDGSLRVTDVALACGFTQTGTFTRVFHRAPG